MTDEGGELAANQGGHEIATTAAAAHYEAGEPADANATPWMFAQPPAGTAAVQRLEQPTFRLLGGKLLASYRRSVWMIHIAIPASTIATRPATNAPVPLPACGATNS